MNYRYLKAFSLSVFLILSACGFISDSEEQKAKKYNELISESERLIGLKKHKSAIDTLSRAIRLDSAKPDAWYGRGYCLSERAFYDSARADFNRVILRNPDYKEVYFNRGVCALQLNRFRQALKDFNKAIDKDSTQADYYLNRGVAYQNLQDTVMACKDYRKASQMGQLKAGKFIKRFCR